LWVDYGFGIVDYNYQLKLSSAFTQQKLLNKRNGFKKIFTLTALESLNGKHKIMYH